MPESDSEAMADRPYLRIGQATVFVRDRLRSVRFYRDLLGFPMVRGTEDDTTGVAGDDEAITGEAWVAVLPPDGSAVLELAAPEVGSEEYDLIGRGRRLTFLSDDVDRVYREWRARGVVFLEEPADADWGGRFARFQDPDGNVLSVAGFDQVTQQLERERRETAAKAEAERKAAQEQEFARAVQTRLFPQVVPRLGSIEVAGRCFPSRSVGGDLFDFLDLGEDQVGLVMGDVAGKGVAAALLMVNLQATLRGHAGLIAADPLGVLRTVNAEFFRSTGDSAYATLLLALFDGARRTLRYVNCGHLPGLVLRRDGTVDRMEPTGTVLGLFPVWEGQVRECTVRPGDVLALYTDGVTEAVAGADGEEFGEGRLVVAMRRLRDGSAEAMAEGIAGEVRLFWGEEQGDDVTVIAARVL